MQKRKPLISLAVSLIVILSIAGIIFAFAGGPPVGATGSVIFGQQSCAQAGCHSGLAVNSSAGSLTLAGVPANYTLGQSYDLTITINQPNQRRWGFQLSSRARTSTNSVGSFQSLDGFSQLQSLGGITYFAHNTAGTRAGTAGPVSFQVRWTAPATNVGEVVFSVAGNAANNDNNSTGDFIHFRESSSQPPGSAAGPTITNISPNSGSVNGGTPVVITGTGFASGATVAIGGAAATNVTVDSATQITATTGASGTPGTVNVVVTVGGESATLTGGFTYSASTSTPAPTSSAHILPFVVDTAAFRTNLIMSNLTGVQANVTAHFVEGGRHHIRFQVLHRRSQQFESSQSSCFRYSEFGVTDRKTGIPHSRVRPENRCCRVSDRQRHRRFCCHPEQSRNLGASALPHFGFNSNV